MTVGYIATVFNFVRLETRSSFFILLVGEWKKDIPKVVKPFAN